VALAALLVLKLCEDSLDSLFQTASYLCRPGSRTHRRAS
jgi:hypothetical protein